MSPKPHRRHTGAVSASSPARASDRHGATEELAVLQQLSVPNISTDLTVPDAVDCPAGRQAAICRANRIGIYERRDGAAVDEASHALLLIPHEALISPSCAGTSVRWWHPCRAGWQRGWRPASSQLDGARARCPGTKLKKTARPSSLRGSHRTLGPSFAASRQSPPFLGIVSVTSIDGSCLRERAQFGPIDAVTSVATRSSRRRPSTSPSREDHIDTFSVEKQNEGAPSATGMSCPRFRQSV